MGVTDDSTICARGTEPLTHFLLDVALKGYPSSIDTKSSTMRLDVAFFKYVHKKLVSSSNEMIASFHKSKANHNTVYCSQLHSVSNRYERLVTIQRRNRPYYCNRHICIYSTSLHPFRLRLTLLYVQLYEFATIADVTKKKVYFSPSGYTQ